MVEKIIPSQIIYKMIMMATSANTIKIKDMTLPLSSPRRYVMNELFSHWDAELTWQARW